MKIKLRRGSAWDKLHYITFQLFGWKLILGLKLYKISKEERTQA